jgi:hypothetical protein
MSVGQLLQDAAKASLEAHAPLADGVSAVLDAAPARAMRPYALVGDPLLADWGTKDMAGREARLSVLLFDAGERPARLRVLAAEAEAAIEAMPRMLGQGWALASLMFVRGRIVREGEGRWTASSEWRVRLLRSEL